MAEIELTPLRKTPNTSARGAASELTACAALLSAGYIVYRCESHWAPFDLVAYRDGKCWRVEVKSVTLLNGYGPNFAWPTNREWDLLVVVGSDRVFCFDADTDRPTARDVIRQHYGFPPLEEARKAQSHAASFRYSPRTADVCVQIESMLTRAIPRKEIAKQLNINVATVDHVSAQWRRRLRAAEPLDAAK